MLDVLVVGAGAGDGVVPAPGTTVTPPTDGDDCAEDDTCCTLLALIAVGVGVALGAAGTGVVSCVDVDGDGDEDEGEGRQ
ncbi:hypothetical protein Pelo_19796 [Pelomyxa schiedti]|nr:hypothetical protein Pelo_19796 [Pelomyxa schiedti]